MFGRQNVIIILFFRIEREEKEDGPCMYFPN